MSHVVYSICESLSLKNISVEGKVVLCFSKEPKRRALNRAVTAVRKAGGVGVIVARNPSDSFGPCDKDFPCVEVDYELGTRILFYVFSTPSAMVKISPSRTLVGRPVSTKVAYFSSRGPSSISPAILKVYINFIHVNLLQND